VEKQEKSVSKHLYKILIYVLKYIPFILALMETVFVVLNYYELPHYYLNVFEDFQYVLLLLYIYNLTYSNFVLGTECLFIMYCYQTLLL
jgi:hypothetical protein